MRSLLIAPADEQRLAEALQSGADAVIVDLAQAAPATREEARATAARFLKEARGTGAAPALIVRVNGLDSGETDADLDTVMAHAPDAILMAGSLGAASVQQLSAKLAVREAEFALPDGGTRIIAVADTAQSLFSMGSYRGSSARLDRRRLERGALARRYRRRDGPRPLRRSSWRLSTRAGVDAARRDVGARGGDRRGSSPTLRDLEGLRAEALAARRDGFAGKMAIDPAQVGAINAIFPSRSTAACERKSVVAPASAASAPLLLDCGLARLDLGHPLVGVHRPSADHLHVFAALHKICAGNHCLRIQSAHHWIVDGRTADHVNRGFRLTIRVRQRGRAYENHD